jgi:hypothetical protein
LYVVQGLVHPLPAFSSDAVAILGLGPKAGDREYWTVTCTNTGNTESGSM